MAIHITMGQHAWHPEDCLMLDTEPRIRVIGEQR